MKRFKVETGRMKGAPECMRISGFMHGVNNSELTKCLNEHVPKTMEEMMITTTAFIRGEATAARKKKELVRAGKLSHLIKEIKHGRDQSNTGKKETTAKDKPTTIYMIQSWQRTTRQKKYAKDLVEIHNIKQKDGENIEDFMKRFKVETGRMKGAPECMRISGFMHGVNNSELTKCLNEHVPKTMEEMMITTTAFIRGEATAARKKKGHAS
nr:reverse transcriptase domain-containing protein [Tanacetum cinerariifolium]